MSDLKSMLTEEQVKNLEMSRGIYQGRMRDYINRRADELVKFGKMQSSLIVQPNQAELKAQAEKLHALDFEIKRLGDCVRSCTVIISYHVIPELMDNLKHVRDQIMLAYNTLIDVNIDLAKTPVEAVFAVSIVRDYFEYASSLYPQTNIFEQASFVRQQNLAGKLTTNDAADDSKGVDGLSGSLLVSV